MTGIGDYCKCWGRRGRLPPTTITSKKKCAANHYSPPRTKCNMPRMSGQGCLIRGLTVNGVESRCLSKMSIKDVEPETPYAWSPIQVSGQEIANPGCYGRKQ